MEWNFCRIFNLNFKATVNVSQTVARNMIENKVEGGTIVNVSSVVKYSSNQ